LLVLSLLVSVAVAVVMSPGVASADRAKASAVSYWLLNGHSRKCATVQGASTTAGAPVIQYECEFSGPAPYNGEWFIEPVGTGNTIHIHSNQCLVVEGASRASGAAIVQWPCALVREPAPYNEEWTIEHLATGWAHVRNYHSDMCLVVKGAGTANNVPLIQYPCGNFQEPAPYNEEWLI
jgi:hypothetical protein